MLWLLTELGQDYVQVDVGGPFGGNNAPDYLALNPNGRVPTLVHDEFVLWESNAICRYLARHFDDGRLYPTSRSQRALCEQWMDWQLGTLQSSMVPLFIGLVRTPERNRDMHRLAALKEEAASHFQLLDDALSNAPYLLGEQPTLADMGNAIWTHRWFSLGMDSTPMPHLQQWYARLALDPAFKTHVVDVPLA